MSSNTGRITSNVDALIRDIEVACEWSSSLDREVLFKPTKNPIKSNVLASGYRKIGKNYYRKKNSSYAKLSYTKSISHAEEGSEELYVAYGKRSALLFELGKFVPCLLDINRAMKTNYCPPNHLWQKLLDRKKQYLSIMKSSSAGAISGIDEDATNPPIDDQEPSWRADLLSKFGNPLLPNASPKIELKYDKEWGRHFVATADIKPGEPLMSEDYFATALFTDNSPLIYCDFCLTFCDALIPCLECARTMYCTEQCRKRAYDSYHRLECKLSFFFPSNYNSETEVIAIRMFLIGTKQGEALEDLMNTLSIPDLFVENYDFTDKPIASDYLTALRLPHKAFDRTYIINESLMERAVKVVTVLRLLEFFESVPVDRVEDAVVFATALLINNHFGSTFLFKFRRYNREFPIVKERDLCHGLLLLHNFLNHSCFPNVATYNIMTKKRGQIMFAVRPIKKGEQLFISYGVDFVNSPKAKRTRQFSNFTCRCEACCNNWSTYSESGFRSITSLPQLWKRIIEDKVPSVDMREFSLAILNTADIAAPLLDDDLLKFRVNEIIPIVAEMISLLHDVMAPMSFCLVQLRDLLLYFVGLHYEREFDPTRLNRNLKIVDLPDIVWTTIERKFSTEECLCVRGVETLVVVIHRLTYYTSLYLKK